MEPNVDRGMWAVLALLIAVGIGSITVIAFPGMVEDITKKMSASVDSAEITNPPRYMETVLAQDEDFSGLEDGSFVYTGSDKFVEIPNIIKGVPVTSYSLMFRESSVEKVVSKNKNIINMYGMFQSSKSSYLDVSELDTSNTKNMGWMFGNALYSELDLSNFYTGKAENMQYMFHHSKVKNLDLSNFDTSNVTSMHAMLWQTDSSVLDLRSFNTSKVISFHSMLGHSAITTVDVSGFDTSSATDMSRMFENSKIKVIDLSTFNIDKVTNFHQMFRNSSATTGFAKTEQDANKFNFSSDKPASLVFTKKK